MLKPFTEWQWIGLRAEDGSRCAELVEVSLTRFCNQDKTREAKPSASARDFFISKRKHTQLKQNSLTIKNKKSYENRFQFQHDHPLDHSNSNQHQCSIGRRQCGCGIMEKSTIIQYSTAVAMLVSGMVMSFIGFFTEPIGQISDSVLWYLSQCLIYAGSVFGLTLYIDGRLKAAQGRS